jgi:biopolymer transport protein TolR
MSKIKKRNSGFDSIELTNLIDVLMVLLILFMIIAPPVFRENAAKVNLPEANIDTMEIRSDVQVFLTKDGEVYVNEYRVDSETVKKYLEEQQNLKIEKVVINADQDVPYHKVLDMIGIFQDLEAESINLSAEKKEMKPVATGPDTAALKLSTNSERL